MVTTGLLTLFFVVGEEEEEEERSDLPDSTVYWFNRSHTASVFALILPTREMKSRELRSMKIASAK